MRNTAPHTALPSALPEVKIERRTLSNGIPLHAISAGTQDVVRVSLVFEAGTCYQPQKLVASAALALMSEGTQRLTAAQVAENFDFLGSSYEHHIDKDFAMLTVYSLSRHLRKTLETLSEIVLRPTFVEEELRTYCAKRKQQLSIEKERVAYIAREQFLASIYGANHAYGSFAQPQDYDLLRREQLQQFHTEYFTANRCFILLAGKVGGDEVKMLEDFFGKISAGKNTAPLILPQVKSEAKNLRIEKTDAVQSAVRMGRTLFTKQHPDFAPLHVLTVALGGYFGSRLMRNIREEKGYTYGIFSTLVNHRQGGHLSIGAEVGKEHAQATVDEICKELQRFCDEKISHEELMLVKNYISGEVLRSLDGPWGLAEVALDNLCSDLPYSYAHKLFDTLKNITPEQLQALARSYFSPASMSSVIA
ncbi:MAG: insulinase family protein [Prevotellaceae bacterium]|jgi:predicted Zn-dependent peptidase|nr:insulinase family protein [Prevotellaceae bacterium]